MTTERDRPSKRRSRRSAVAGYQRGEVTDVSALYEEWMAYRGKGGAQNFEVWLHGPIDDDSTYGRASVDDD